MYVDIDMLLMKLITIIRYYISIFYMVNNYSFSYSKDDERKS